jgi:hypothetical protein
MFFTGATAPGTPETPNEDWIGATSDLAVLLDGATSRTETGCRHGAAWYTRKLGATIIAEAASRSLSLGEVLANAIGEVARLHPECDLTHPGTPSAAAAIVRVEDDQLRYLVLGDVTIFLELDHGIRIISDHRVSQTATFERAEADRHLIGSEGKARALIAMKHAELAAKNRGEGYWIAAAQPGLSTTPSMDRSPFARFGVWPYCPMARLAWSSCSGCSTGRRSCICCRHSAHGS